MGKLGRWKEQMVSALEIPPDLAYSETIITMTGSMEILIENYKSISRYTPTEIVVRSSSGKDKHLWKKSGDSLVYFQAQ